ncbi:hypothetical protein [Lysinibacillus xylanilyticus]|uniref:hypothetical protein n=1 Tax=Lysinibacillus xylanilyticus TaxID=582475 RepID=UPI0036DC8DD2
MKKTYESGDKFFAFGVDSITGVFIQFHHEAEDINITNWSEFEPVNRRLSYDVIQEAIKKGELLELEFKRVISVSNSIDNCFEDFSNIAPGPSS